MEVVGAVVIPAVAGLLVGIGIWFPYKAVLNHLVNKKREATSMLMELGMSEQEHSQSEQMQWIRQPIPVWPGTGTGVTQGTWTTPKTWTTGGWQQMNNTTVAPQYGNAPTANETSLGSFASSTTSSLASRIQGTGQESEE
jgi:hypothetical protein